MGTYFDGKQSDLDWFGFKFIGSGMNWVGFNLSGIEPSEKWLQIIPEHVPQFVK